MSAFISNRPTSARKVRPNFNMKWTEQPASVYAGGTLLLVVFNLKLKFVINVIKEQRKINCSKKFNANGLCINSNDRLYSPQAVSPGSWHFDGFTQGAEVPRQCQLSAVKCKGSETSMWRKNLKDSPTLCVQSGTINSPESWLTTICARSWRWTSLGQFSLLIRITTTQVALLVPHLSSLETLELSLESGISVYLYTMWRSFFH